jgi:serine/threonine protein kinase
MNAKPGKVRINKVKERILFLSPSVKLGHENEANLRDFDLSELLGSGAFGSVYKVTHKVSKRVFALKVIEKTKIKKNKMENQIQNEVKIMYSLDNENIVRLFNHFEDDESIYLVLEFAEEGQLMNKLKKAPGRKLTEIRGCYLHSRSGQCSRLHSQSEPPDHPQRHKTGKLAGRNGELHQAGRLWVVKL